MGLPEQVMEVEAAGRGTLAQMLEEATSVPALPTFEEPPGDTGDRVGRVLRNALKVFISVARTYNSSQAPDKEVRLLENAMWLWIMPALLLAKPIQDFDDLQKLKPFSDTKPVKKRLARAETGHHGSLLLHYLNDVDKRNDMAALPIRGD